MNKLLTALLQRVRTWPPEAQEELLALAQEIEAELADGSYTPLDEDSANDDHVEK